MKNMTNVTKEQLNNVIKKLNEEGVIDINTMYSALEFIRNNVDIIDDKHKYDSCSW